MMFRSFGRTLLAMAFSLSLAPLLTSCGNGHTIGFAYVLSSPNVTSSSIWIYKINSDTGKLTAAGTPSLPSTNYINPVYAVVSPDNNYLYVLYGPTINADTGLPNPNGQDAIIVYGIHHESNVQAGDITPLETYNTGGTEPVSLALDPSGKFLYAVDFYQEAFSNASPGPGDLTIFDINTDGTLAAPTCTGGNLATSSNGNICSYPVGYSPRSATQLANGSYVYVTNSGLASVSCSAGVSGFQLNSGGLTAINFPIPSGSCTNPTPLGSLPFGSQPWAITSDSSSSFVYITDAQQSLLYATQVTPSTGNLTTLLSSAVGSKPYNAIVDPTSAYVYVSNFSSNSISAFAIGSGATPLTAVSGSPFSTGTAPLCMSAQTPYFYNVNQISGSVSGFEIGGSGAPGTLTVVHDQPFQVSTSSSSSPTCMAIANF